MLFNSDVFIFVFLPVAVLGFYLVCRLSPRAGAAWLVLASLVFYGWWYPPFLVLLLCSVLTNYAIGEGIVATGKHPRLQYALLILGIAVNLGALFYYKYLMSILAFLSGHGIAMPNFGTILLPLGISFYTFTQIGYLVDCREGTTKGRGFLNYMLFVTFFPHLIAGPILHHREMMPQFAQSETYRFRVDNLAIGLTIFVIGLLKKSLIADSLSPSVGEGFALAGTAGLATAWNAVLSYSFQLYFDFSGYSDMAIGIARMFNVVFPANFNSPYKSKSIIEFWQRWHMTLTRYLTLLLYNPIALAVARGRAARGMGVGRSANSTLSGFSSLVLMPTMVTMGLAGIWHGAGLQFLIFGLLHGVYLTINHAWRIFRPTRAAESRSWVVAMVGGGAGLIVTYLAVLVAQVFFRSASVDNALAMLAGMIGLHGIGGHEHAATGVLDLARLALAFAIVWFAPNTQEIMARTNPTLGKAPAIGPLSWRPNFGWTLAFALAIVLAVLSLSDDPREFLYFQF
jgi:alginate O-acetyltransferase complex protein AlgI